MITAITISSILVILIIGFVKVYSIHKKIVDKIKFAKEFKNSLRRICNPSSQKALGKQPTNKMKPTSTKPSTIILAIFLIVVEIEILESLS